MEWREFTDLMLEIVKLSKEGWIYSNSNAYEDGKTSMYHESYGLYKFESLKELEDFVNIRK